MKKINSKILTLAAVFAGFALSAAERPPETVAVDSAKKINSVIRRRYIGTLSGELDVSLVPRVSGVIVKQMFKDGDFVKKGQLLFQIEDTTYRAAVESARARLAQAKVEYDYARRNLERTATLRSQKAVSESSYDEAVRLEGSCAAAVAAAKAALLDAENNLSYTKIISPLNGRAGKAALSEHNYVTPSTGNILTVVSLDPINVDFSISSRDYLKMFGSLENLKKYADITITLADRSVYPAKAKIIFMDNRVDKNTDSIKLRATISNKDLKLIPDSLVTVNVARRTDEAVVGIPPAALLSDGKKSFVYTLDKNSVVTVRVVVPGELDGDNQIILKGLAEGETIIVDGTHKALPGTKVVALPVKEGK